MTDRDRRSEFLNFMRMPDGSPLATLDILDYLTTNGFFSKPLPPPSITGIMKVVFSTIPFLWQNTWLV